ncbi:hypothetical protein [Phaeacidiphilus oryzae]|uniref:hypothetical protein n=1 Tax=Phaeacidiphilus oryzae TaxID=348818 RepID=UPI00056D305C|nr:hypothetical protein [Phaeacidiphilus oryzae]
MNRPTPFNGRPETAIQVHHPIPLTPTAAPLTVVPGAIPDVQSVQLPDGRIVTGYTLTPPPATSASAPVAEQQRPAASRLAVNLALGGVGFAAVCGGLALLTTFIVALTALIEHLIILAAILFGGFVIAQILAHTGRDHGREGTTVNIGKAVFKRNHFHG